MASSLAGEGGADNASSVSIGYQQLKAASVPEILKIHRARQLPQETDLPIKTIAQTLGFESSTIARGVCVRSFLLPASRRLVVQRLCAGGRHRQLGRKLCLNVFEEQTLEYARRATGGAGRVTLRDWQRAVAARMMGAQGGPA